MGDHTLYLNTMRMIMGTSSAITNHTNIVTLNRIKIYILEMEDVLFHLNSAVMMPENPEGKSSDDSGGGSSDQETMSGLSALGLVYKQFEFDPNKRMIIAGHTDTSGQPKGNFDLSEERAKNILYLLTGEKDNWAEICANRHKVEDYQQIMKFFAEKNGIDCDPDKIDNKWGDKTEKATKGFLEKTLPDDAKSLLKDIKADSKKKWPEAVWKAVYDLYIQHICKVLGLKGEEQLKEKRSSLKFVNDSMPFVPCGESFPIDSKEKKNYRSQENRRVEILFFDKDEIDAEKIKCPPSGTTVHKEEECPLWKKIYFLPLYIDPKDLTSVVYHIKFVYYDRVQKKVLPVPKGLTINAYKNDTTQISTVTAYEKGIYKVKVQFNKSETPDTLKDFHFRFETDSFYVFTKDNASATKPEIKKEADILTEKKVSKMGEIEVKDQLKYYDLPKKWSSKNYWTRYDGDMKKGDAFEKVIKEKAKLKPFDQNITKPDKPLVFSLDDIVLVNTTFDPIAWQERYRFTVFNINFTINNADTDKPFLTKGKVKKNFFLDSVVGNNVRAIAVNCEFYDTYNKRTEKGPVIGARAGVKEDSDVHVTSGEIKEPMVSGAGNLELHYFSHCLDTSDKPVSILLIYWTGIFQKGIGVSDADVNNFIKHGMVNSKARWEKKGYKILPKEDPSNKSITVIPKLFLEARDMLPYKCVVTVNTPGGRANMGLTSANFKTNIYQSSGTAVTEDGKNFKAFTMAHEVGHAIGLDDEYIESISEDSKWNPVLPQFKQYYPGMPYSFDDISMMEANKVPRLRQFWYFARWMNEKNEVKTLTGNTVFQVDYKGGKKYTYHLKDTYKDFYTPASKENNAINGSSGKFGLYLYKMGHDESTECAVKGQKGVDGILVVTVKMQCFFKKGIIARWSNDEKLDHLRNFQRSINNNLNKKFYLECSAEDDFKKIYIYFVPHYLFESSSKPGHFKTTFEAAVFKSTMRDPDFFKSGFTSNNFIVDEYQGSISTFRYMLGLSTYTIKKRTFSNSKKSIETISTNDLNFLGTWVSKKRGKGLAYTIKT